MIKSLSIVVRRGPYGTINAGEALRHASGGITFGVATTLVLTEDGVYVAVADQHGERVDFTSLAGPVAQLTQQKGTMEDGSAIGGRVVVHEPSLVARGLAAGRLVAGVEIVDDAALANLLGECDAVLTY